MLLALQVTCIVLLFSRKCLILILTPIFGSVVVLGSWCCRNGLAAFLLTWH